VSVPRAGRGPGRRLAELVARTAPRLGTSLWLYRLLRRQSRALARAGDDPRPPRDLVRQTPDGRFLEIVDHELLDVRIQTGPMTASQKHDELMPLLDKIDALRPRFVCEIGTSAGGTLYLLTRVSHERAVIVSVDLAIPPHTASARAGLAKKGQRLISIDGDSHSEVTKDAVLRALGENPLDVLFIDGDHSYEGVRADFEDYAPLVRAGGIVALHDVNPDFRTRHDVETPSISGDVPRYWSELKEQYKTEELIADPDQDGFGIGVVYV
jgi:predicted O-methyltransferase YrrM